MKQNLNICLVPNNFKDSNICILGLGFVGLTLASVMAERGFNVSGIEIREDVLKSISTGNPLFLEPGLPKLLKDVISQNKLSLHTKIPDTCTSTVFIITVGTPIDDQKKVKLDSITSVADQIAKNLKDGDLILLRSTVKIGVTRNLIKPILDKTGKKYEIAFCPERTVEGQAISELRYLPQIIGSDCTQTSMRAAAIFQFLTPTTVRVSNYETAEMIKLVDNTKRDVIFGFSNEIAKLCDAIGLSAHEVICSGRFGYSRTDMPSPGLVGGPCLSKDSYILAESLKPFGIVPEITLAARKVNEDQPVDVLNFISNHFKMRMIKNTNPVIGFLGIAFKGSPPTDDLRGTTAKSILDAVKSLFPSSECRGFDPVVKSESLIDFGLIPYSDVNNLARNADILLILNNHAFFSSLDLETIAKLMNPNGLIYDFWNNYQGRNTFLPNNINYISLGSHCIAKNINNGCI